MSVKMIHGDCLEVLAGMGSESCHSCVTDPPYELGFMGKAWDGTGIAYNVNVWREVLRVLKPGGHLIAFGGSRTYHRLAVAVEDAGFEIRDQGLWLYGSGFPKSLDVSKAIDKAAGVEREDLGPHPNWREGKLDNGQSMGRVPNEARITAPATPDAIKWNGWGTALKPAHEPFVIGRKPFSGTVAANVLEHGTGALNVDGCRVGGDYVVTTGRCDALHAKSNSLGSSWSGEVDNTPHKRFPANLIHDGSEPAIRTLGPESRYFYCAKASRAEREAGLGHLDTATGAEACDRTEGSAGLDNPRAGAGRTASTVRNIHPTVKPLSLMRYLVRLVTPPGGTVLEPFAGSGTTLVACVHEGFGAIGIELTEDYLPIINGRVAHAEKGKNGRLL
jgi:DNA modification methylase